MPSNGSPWVLVVEDESELRLLFATLLEVEGFSVLQAVDGLAGLGILRDHLNDIVLLISDLGLPNMEGIELITRAREMKPSLKIIGTSGLGGPNVRELVLAAGAQDFIPKPFVVREVAEKVRLLMSTP